MEGMGEGVALSGLQAVLVGVAPSLEGFILVWTGKEISHEIMLLGVFLEDHFSDPPQAPGLWVWEGHIEPPYLPKFVESDEVDASACWKGSWRRPTEEELSWFGAYGRNPWEQDLS